MQTYGEIDLLSSNKYTDGIDAKRNRLRSEQHLKWMAEEKTVLRSLDG